MATGACLFRFCTRVFPQNIEKFRNPPISDLCKTQRWSRRLAACPTLQARNFKATMHTLYDSDSYTVTHMLANAALVEAADSVTDDANPTGRTVPVMARHGFEIVDKRNGKELYLDGSWAELFQQHISAWQLKTPTQEEVEDTLEQYAELAQNPIVAH